MAISSPGRKGTPRPAHASRKKPDPVDRILDANANRCREGLRVAEDAARFLFEDLVSARAAKRLRHLVTRGMGQLPSRAGMLVARDAEADRGRNTFGRSERARSGVPAVVASNLHRAQEAARVLEEFGKLYSPTASLTFKKLRYGIYTLEKSVMSKRGNKDKG